MAFADQVAARKFLGHKAQPARVIPVRHDRLRPVPSLCCRERVTQATQALNIKDSCALLRSGKLKTSQAMLMSEAAKEGPKAFAEKREPIWKGK
jgi:1,4-dihydroxy-2-naphthoyl-CoA synthase